MTPTIYFFQGLLYGEVNQFQLSNFDGILTLVSKENDDDLCRVPTWRKFIELSSLLTCIVRLGLMVSTVYSIRLVKILSDMTCWMLWQITL